MSKIYVLFEGKINSQLTQRYNYKTVSGNEMLFSSGRHFLYFYCINNISFYGWQTLQLTKIMCFAFMLISFLVIWKEGSSTEKMPSSHWPVGKDVGHFLD